LLKAVAALYLLKPPYITLHFGNTVTFYSIGVKTRGERDSIEEVKKVQVIVELGQHHC
jgi:hypothetical protein